MKNGNSNNGKEERKVGLNTCILVGIIISPNYYEFIKSKLPIESFLFIHEICLQETIDVLCRDFRYNKEAAIAQVREKIEELGIEKVELNEKNSDFAEEILRKSVEKAIPLNEPDNIWLVDLVKDRKANLIISQDKTVIRACREILDVNARKVPHQDNIVAMDKETIENFFKFFHKFGRKKK